MMMNNELIIALVGLSGVLLGAIIAGMTERKISDRTLNSQYITDKRIQWIQELRNEVAIFESNTRFVLGYSNANNKDVYNETLPETILEVNRSANKIKLMLNPNEDGVAIGLVDDILSHLSDAIIGVEGSEEETNVRTALMQLTEEMQGIFKKEWERSKMEVLKGVKRKKRR